MTTSALRLISHIRIKQYYLHNHICKSTGLCRGYISDDCRYGDLYPVGLTKFCTVTCCLWRAELQAATAISMYHHPTAGGGKVDGLQADMEVSCEISSLPDESVADQADLWPNVSSTRTARVNSVLRTRVSSCYLAQTEH